MRRPLSYLFGLLLCFNYGCNMEQIGSNLGKGVREQLELVPIDSLAETAVKTTVRTALDEAFEDDLHEKIQAELGPILGQVSDSLEITVDKAIKKALGKHTEEWLDRLVRKQSDQLSTKLVGTTDSLIATLLGDKTQAQVKVFIRRALFDEIDAYLSRVIGQVSTPENMEKLTFLRENISEELDSLVASVIVCASENYDESFAPEVDSLVEKINIILRQGQQLGENTQKGASSILWQTIGGLATLILFVIIGVLAVNTRRYKQMLKVITHQINEIPNQAEYDKLTNKIKRDLDMKGLNIYLQRILHEEKLDNQPEWDDKDKQVLRLLSTYLNKLKETDKKKDEVLPELYTKAQELGIDDHLDSVMDRMA